MDELETLDSLEATRALQRGHFKLSSGRHSDTYIQCAMLLEDPDRAVEVGRELASKIDREIDFVLCPAVGALVIGFTTALALGRRMMFAERIGGKMVLRRGFCLPEAARVLLVDDVITTGGSVMELAALVEDAASTVVGIGCVVQRGEIETGPYPLASLVKIDVESFDPEDCPMCAEGLEVDSPGSRFTQ